MHAVLEVSMHDVVLKISILHAYSSGNYHEFPCMQLWNFHECSSGSFHEFPCMQLKNFHACSSGHSYARCSYNFHACSFENFHACCSGNSHLSHMQFWNFLIVLEIPLYCFHESILLCLCKFPCMMLFLKFPCSTHTVLEITMNFHACNSEISMNAVLEVSMNFHACNSKTSMHAVLDILMRAVLTISMHAVLKISMHAVLEIHIYHTCSSEIS